MGADLSKEQVAHVKELGQILRASKSQLTKQFVLPTKSELRQLLIYTWQRCPSYPYHGSLKPGSWVKLGIYFHQEPRAPASILLTWKVILAALRIHHSDSSLDPPSDLPDSTPPPPYPDRSPAPIPALASDTSLNPTPSTAPSAPSNVYSASSLTSSTAAGGAVARGLALARSDPSLTTDDLEFLSAFPADLSGAAPVYDPIPFTVLKNLREAASQYGVTSVYVQTLFKNLSMNYHLLPCDWNLVAEAVLTSTQFVVWRSLYDQRCVVELGQNNQFTVAQLRGEGAFATQQQQLTIPLLGLLLIAKCALYAFSKLDDPASKSASSFTTIRQAPSEPYDTFIERLQKALKRDINNSNVRQEVLMRLAYENANEDCRRVLEPLHGDSTKTLADFLQKAARVGSLTYQAEMQAELMASALSTLNAGGVKPRSGNCFNCGKPGHFRNQCRAPGGGAAAQTTGVRPKTACPRCGRMGHWARECRSGRSPNSAPAMPSSHSQSGN